MIEGHVRDASTGRPVAGATVELTTRSAQAADYASLNNEMKRGARTRTDADGSFHIATRHNFHLLWYANPSFQFHIPSGSYWLGESTVSREGYESVALHSQAELEDVRLVPKP